MDDGGGRKRQGSSVPGSDAGREPARVPGSPRRGQFLARQWARHPAAAQRRGTLTAVTLATFCVEVSFLALMLALPAMARSFGKTPEVTQDALSAYLLSLGATLVVAGRVADVAGRRRVFAGGCLLFTLMLVGSALAPSLPVLVVFRVLQGAGAGLMLPTGIALVATGHSGAARQARALGLSFALASTGTVIGPLLGGWLAEGPGWRWIFWLLVPVAALTAAITAVFVPESRLKAPPSFDFLGAAMVVLAVAAVGTGIDRADSVGWTAVNIALPAAGLVIIALLPLRARRAAHPLVHLSAFRNPRFGLVLFLAAVRSGCYPAIVFVVSLYLQDARRLTAVRASLLLATMAILMALAAPVGARVRPGSRQVLLMTGAGAIFSGALVVLTVATSSWWAYLAALAICGFGLGLGSSLAMIVSQQVVGPEHAGEMSGIVLTIQTTAAGICLAVTAGIVDGFERSGHGIAGACDLTLLIVAFLSLAASVIATAAGYAFVRRGLI
jgi:MFS family permease